MPIYEYKCRSCSSDFEELIMSKTQEAELICPHCGSGKLARALSVFGMSTSEGFSSSAPAGASCSGCSTKSCGSCH